MISGNEIRRTFLDYFAANGHEPVASSPLVPHNDPTLMFTNAGMVQFKNVFTGVEQRPYKRAATSQKCVRAGGKHNDLDNVGYTARHHTFFEMLGNFSFGDYFKERAIELAWNLITDEFGLSKDRLCVTVYHEDDEAHDLWRRIAGLPEERIIRIATSDNFWAMGDTGPCGPCSEIFYDHGDHIPGGPPGSPDEDGDRFVEIWNLVFMQYEQQSADRRVDLPRPSIDTGMGLERIAAILQGKHDNYDTDLLRKLIEASAEAIGVDPDGEGRISHRVIADHLRASSFLIADGVLPSNEGRGYVLRRIMRRAMRHAEMLGAEEPLLHRLVPTLVGMMGQAFPELGRAEPLIRETLKLEENNFKRTLARGLRLLEDELERLGDSAALPGEVAFKLYDTYGFPLDLTQDALRARGRGVDVDGFNAAMARQKAEARKSWAGSGEQATEAVWFDLRDQVGASEFLGYATERAEGEVVAIVRDGAPVERLEAGESGALILNQTPFYGESGGQVGDTGRIAGPGGVRFIVEDTQKRAADLHVHTGRMEKGAIAVGDALTLTVDGERRNRIRANHSVTHLLHKALRETLGEHVTQKGSLVADDRLRFDFSHPKALTEDEIAAVEAAVNGVIRSNGAVATTLMRPDEAVEAGALALFGEKYGEEVRVVAMGRGTDRPYSVELCGGIHVRRTGDIALFKIISEGAVAAGVRRIEAVTGEAARQYMLSQEIRLREAASALRAAPADVPGRVVQLIEERKRLERELMEARKALATGGGKGGIEVREIEGVRYASRKLDNVPPKDLRGIVDQSKKDIGSGVVALVSVSDGKAALVVGVTDDLLSRCDARILVRAGSAALGGKGGGGRPEFAQAGGPDGAAAEAALAAIAEAIVAPQAA
ncbi:alanine--tRNA ligase [Oceanibacterium hippocampi]|uniref:Alanine--tRNA ligase n=1 Tax=Oceanibacterium hippocampi TaxID=745714 RepID=A0A1Y5TYY3_9PROT|nr:alanine--tRNA ligase [Oceanibacterium hippocampi]SLN76837.1 Alanine--tRNA ligase [Oceanibacterium hippocampi]